MDISQLIPSYQPIPFPAPIWLLETLLVLGFFLHVIPMNVALGGGFISATAMFLGRNDRSGYLYKMGRSLALALPLFVSAAITQGIVPLLFLQLLYGPMFYTSSLLMAVPWLSIVALIIIAYYLSYWAIYRYLKPKYIEGATEHTAQSDATDRGLKAPLPLFIGSLIFLFVAFLFTNNMTLMVKPELWLQMYKSSQAGLALPPVDTVLIARYTHFVLAAFAVTGLAIGCFSHGFRRRDPDFATWLIKRGSAIYAAITVVQIGVGIWFLMSLPKEIMMKFMGGDKIASAVFGASLVAMVISLICSTLSSQSGGRRAFVGALSTAALTVLGMVIARHMLRTFYLGDLISPASVPVKTQWDLLIVFILFAVLLIAYLIWLVRLVYLAAQNRASGSISSDVTTA